MTSHRNDYDTPFGMKYDHHWGLLQNDFLQQALFCAYSSTNLVFIAIQ